MGRVLIYGTYHHNSLDPLMRSICSQPGILVAVEVVNDKEVVELTR
jgi:hypothetical protein